jgi:D-serine deaminase-like pyridoxal phosphate-dependent protein
MGRRAARRRTLVTAAAPPYPELDTPSLLFDLEALERNLREMASVANAAGVKLRPHTKTHKAPDVARMQMDAGAAGITVAKVGEAEVMANAGLEDILVAYPILGDSKLRRLERLMERARVRVALDSVEVADGVGRLGVRRGAAVEVLVEVDTGQHRLGRPPGAPTAELAIEIARVAGVDVLGLITHGGHAYASTSRTSLRDAARREGTDVVRTAELCEHAGLPIREVSVGSTPTARDVAGVAGVTEIRPGTYALNDLRMIRLGVADESTCAASVLATTVSRPPAERFVVDAGSKSLTSDGGDAPAPGGWGLIRRHPELRLDFLTEEHAVGTAPTAVPAIGDRVEIIPVHACGCVNMFDVAYGVRSGVVERRFDIAARGMVQ